MDEKDIKILEILAKNARSPYGAIAKAIGISDVAVIRRVKRLEREGVIKGYAVQIDPKRLGYKSISITGIDVEPEHLFRIMEILKNKSYVRQLSITSGDHNLIVVIWGRNDGELAQIHEEISKMEGVKRVCPAIVLDTIKEEFL